MSQQININTVGGNNNCNPNAGRGKGGGQGGFKGQGDCGNNTSIAKLLFGGNR